MCPHRFNKGDRVLSKTNVDTLFSERQERGAKEEGRDENTNGTKGVGEVKRKYEIEEGREEGWGVTGRRKQGKDRNKMDRE